MQGRPLPCSPDAIMQSTSQDSSDDGGRTYVPANRTARKAAKAAKQLQVQEQAQEQSSRDQAALQLRFDQLEADNARITKALKNKRKALKRIRASRSEGISLDGSAGEAPAKSQVVHAAASCDEEDEDVISKDEFLNSTEPGTDDKIDAERAIHAAAQAALLGQAQALSKISPVLPVHYLPPLPALPSSPKDSLFGTRGTSRMECYGGKGEAWGKEFEAARLRERAELEDSPEAAEPTASEVIAEGDNHRGAATAGHRRAGLGGIGAAGGP